MIPVSGMRILPLTYATGFFSLYSIVNTTFFVIYYYFTTLLNNFQPTADVKFAENILKIKLLAYRTAMASISTFTSFGNRATSTHARAGL